MPGIAAAEPAFDAPDFLEGAKAAYEMVVTAFAQGDRKTLKDLLSREVYEGFERAISEREGRGEKVETTFVSIDKAEMVGAEVNGKLIHASEAAAGMATTREAGAIAHVARVNRFGEGT